VVDKALAGLDEKIVEWLQPLWSAQRDGIRSEGAEALARFGVGGRALERLEVLAEHDDSRLVRKAGVKARAHLEGILHGSGAEFPEANVPWHEQSTLARRVLACFRDARLGVVGVDAAFRDGFDSAADPMLAAARVWAMGFLDSVSDESWDWLSSLAEGETRSFVGCCAIRAMVSLSWERSLDLCLGLFDDKREWRARCAVLAIAPKAQERVFARLERQSQSMHQDRRTRAIWGLEHIDLPGVTDVLLQVMAKESSLEVMELAAALLRERAPKETLGAIGFLRRSRDPRLAKVAEVLYDSLLEVHRPSIDELELFESNYRQGQRERARQAIGEPVVSPESPLPRFDIRSNSKSGAVVFVIAVAALLWLVITAVTTSVPGMQ